MADNLTGLAAPKAAIIRQHLSEQQMKAIEMVEDVLDLLETQDARDTLLAALDAL